MKAQEFSKINIQELKDILKKEGNQSSYQFQEWWDVFEIISYCKRLQFSEAEIHSILSNRFELNEKQQQPMTTEQICFRYDGSEEAKKCIEWINETHQRSLCGAQNFYHSLPENGDFGAEKPRYRYRLVTASEFLRLVSEPKWKVGDECYLVSNSHYKWEIVSFHKDNLVKIKREDYEVYYLTHLLRPVRKSVREEVANIIDKALIDSSRIYSGINITDEILSKFNVTPKH